MQFVCSNKTIAGYVTITETFMLNQAPDCFYSGVIPHHLKSTRYAVAM